MTALEFYTQSIRPMPAEERLRVAACILADLVAPEAIDVSDAWSEQDLEDVTQAGRAHIERAMGEGDDVQIW